MHKILERQLRRLQFDPNKPLGPEEMKELLAQVDRAYAQADQDRYLLERSLAISSKEMQALNDQARQEAEKALRVSEGKYRNLFENAIDSIFIIDAESRDILDANQVAAERLGYTREELLSKQIDELNPPEENTVGGDLHEQLDASGSLTFERTHVRKDGTTMPVEVSTNVFLLDGRKVYQSIVRDITERKKHEVELKRLATHDTLTGLPNRALFDDRLSHAIDITKRTQGKVGVLFLDLDGFKSVNDAFGHRQGDTLLRTIARRILGSVRESDTVGRLGGDEFGVLLEGVVNERDIVLIAQKIIKAVAEPFMCQGAEAFITCSIGIGIYPGDGETPDVLIQNADRAMYLSKAEGKNDYRFFKAEMKTQALERLELGNKLRQAIKNQELSLVYQPQVDARTGKIVGLEALARWQHPELGLLLPDAFIPLAEEIGLIIALSDWVLESACRQMKDWAENSASEVRLAVNLSDRDIHQVNIVEKIRGLLEKTELPPHLLELELSEHTIFRNMDKTMNVLDDLRELGVRLAIDDFGTGHSTLSQLAELPFDTLKIDQNFAPKVISSPSSAAIVNGIATIAQNLGVDVVAEGIEDMAQLEFYENLGCHHIQGWLFSRALSVEKIGDLLKQGIPMQQVQLNFDVSSGVQKP